MFGLAKARRTGSIYNPSVDFECIKDTNVQNIMVIAFAWYLMMIILITVL